MKKNFFNKLLFFLVCLLVFNKNALASPIEDNCVDKGTCLTLCNYKTTIKTGGSYSTGYQSQKWTRNLTIYYHYNSKEFSLKWQSTAKDGYIQQKGPDTLGFIFSNSNVNVYWNASKDLDIDTFTCPKYGYLDTSDLNGNNELCFDDNGTACKEMSSNIGTAFGKHGGFESVEKDYDFEEHIKNYQNWIIQDIAKDITDGNVTTNEIPEKVKKDFSTNFLNGNTVPSFIANSDSFKNIIKATENEYSKYKDKELADAEQKYNNGVISDEEYQQIKDNWSASGKEVAEDVDEMLQDIINDSSNPIKDWAGNSCDSILGKKDNPNAPAYFLDKAFGFIKYAAIILFFVLTIMEYFKAIATNDNDALKKATQKTIKRLVICVIIFFLPILIDFIFKLLGLVDSSTCGIGG